MRVTRLIFLSMCSITAVFCQQNEIEGGLLHDELRIDPKDGYPKSREKFLELYGAAEGGSLWLSAMPVGTDHIVVEGDINRDPYNVSSNPAHDDPSMTAWHPSVESGVSHELPGNGASGSLIPDQPYSDHPAFLVNNKTVEGHMNSDGMSWAVLLMIVLACVVCVMTPFAVKFILRRQGEGSTYEGLEGDHVDIMPGVTYGRSQDRTELAIEMGLADPTNMKRVGKFDPIDIQIS